MKKQPVAKRYLSLFPENLDKDFTEKEKTALRFLATRRPVTHLAQWLGITDSRARTITDKAWRKLTRIIITQWMEDTDAHT